MFKRLRQLCMQFATKAKAVAARAGQPLVMHTFSHTVPINIHSFIIETKESWVIYIQHLVRPTSKVYIRNSVITGEPYICKKLGLYIYLRGIIFI